MTFDDIRSGPAAARRKKGYSKILNTCRLALADGYEYAWIDTCCIDKSSSAELSEAINSMYRWYEISEVCYVYLADALEDCRSMHALRQPTSFETGRCRWLSRGWTLQELIAPHSLRFYNRNWSPIEFTNIELADFTGVDIALFTKSKEPRDFSIAKRFSWAAHRSTTRRGDEAYSLLGLFVQFLLSPTLKYSVRQAVGDYALRPIPQAWVS